MATDPHAPLRDDVRLLGTLLGETLRQQGGPGLYECVERIRALSKGARSGQADAAAALMQLLGSLGESRVPVVRAFSHFLALSNIAEQHHRVRRRRAYRMDPTARPQRGSIEDVFERLTQANVSPQAIHEAVCGLNVELVFTAHPTEVVRRTLLSKHAHIADCLARRDRTDLTPEERDALHDELRCEITSIWQTDEIRRTKPTPVDEAKGGLAVLEQILWNAMPRFLSSVDRALKKSTGQGLPLDVTPVRFGSWIGGDRDGNPNVTADVTREVCRLHRWMAADLYLREVDALRAELSLTRCDEALRAAVGDAHEPYRAFLRPVRERLAATRKRYQDLLDGRTPSDAAVYMDPAELSEAFLSCHRSLEAVGAHSVASGRLTDVLRRLAVFGLTLVRLDLRQEASRHTEVLDCVTRHLGIGSYAEWSEDERQDFLVRELAGKRPLIPPDMPAPPSVHEVLQTFRAASYQGPGSLGAYVISMASVPSDVLAVELLQRELGVTRRMRVVPLFETLEALRGAGASVGRLMEVPGYRERLGGTQEVMIGYSDSAKEVGRLAATWALYRAQEDVAQACRDHGVRAILFHGRGGTIDRGGGPAHAAILSQPPGSVDGGLRVTEQGEVIQARFGLEGIALRTLELYTTATLEATLMPGRPVQPRWRELMERLAKDGAKAYRSVVWESDPFADYFRVATPIDELGRLNVGSRPVTRPGRSGLKNLRAIPWVFAWTQTRLLLPSWLGVGEALGALLDGPDAPTIRAMAREWPFFASVLDLVEMALAKADMAIATRYDEALVPEFLLGQGAELRSKFEATSVAVRSALGRAELLEGNPVLKRSIAVRNPYVDPINLIQIDLLRRVRQAQDPALSDALLVTINGIAAGMRNTG